MNNHYKIIHYKKTFDALIKNKTITSLGRYKSSFYINKRKLFFKEEVDRMYYELLGNSIAEYLNINYTYYEPTIIKTATREIKGLVAKDYRREGYSLVKFNKLLNGKETTLDNIKIALDIYFKDYINKEELVNKIYSEVIKHYMLDVVMPDETFNVAKYKSMAESAIEGILKKGKVPIIVGGTGLYINTLVDGIEFADVPGDEEYRKAEKDHFTERFVGGFYRKMFWKIPFLMQKP